jgi:hypothetical protein
MKNLRDYLANTPSANLVEEKIEKTAISIRSVVTNYAKALRYCRGWMTERSHRSPSGSG